MTLKIYNTPRKKKEVFVPLDPQHVRLYHCGPTVYDFAHIGNARPAVVFDVLYRVLQHLYPKVTYVRNITDVDDKIIKAACEKGVDIDHITNAMTQAYHEDTAALGVLPPTVEPRATEHIPHMIDMIETLIHKGIAYAQDGHVLFEVKKDPNYGTLSHRSLDDMIAGARVEVAPYKRNPMDFVLWKPSTADMPGWESPWGRGRPGWHIECSAMSKAYLGNTFDIHVGGQDLVFPHHENERAQSTCANDADFAKYWMHNGYLVVEGEKMSKSLGNFVTMRDALARAPGEVVRLALLTTHYRQPLDWTATNLARARKTLDRLYFALRPFAAIEAPPLPLTPDHPVLDALLDDLNTPLALARLFEMACALNRAQDIQEQHRLIQQIQQAGHLLGLLQNDPQDWFTQPMPGVGSDISDTEIATLIQERAQARAAKDFETSDRIRDTLLANGIVLEDGAQETTWRRLCPETV